MKNGKHLTSFDEYKVFIDGEPHQLYKLCNKLTQAQKDEIHSIAPWVKFMGTQCEYAPELRFSAVAVPWWAERNTTIFYYLFCDDESWEWDLEGQETIDLTA